MHTPIKILMLLLCFFFLQSCNTNWMKPKKVDTRETPVKGEDRARKNISEGRGASLGDLLGKRGGNTNYEFSTSNPMWRASLEILDFLPLATVDYSGGMIITDWYATESSADALKITVRFLANEIRSESLRIVVHKKTCSNNNICTVSLLEQDKISTELHSSILRKAALIDKKKK